MSYVDRVSFSVKQDGNKINIYCIKHKCDISSILRSDKSETKDEIEPLMQFIIDTPFKYIPSKDEFTPRVSYIEIISEKSS